MQVQTPLDSLRAAISVVSSDPDVRAVLSGFSQVCASTLSPREDLKSWICSLSTQPLLAKLRESIAMTAMTQSISVAAQRFSLQEDYILETVKEFIAELERDRDSALFPYQTFDMASQTSRNAMEIGPEQESKSVQAGESVPEKPLQPQAPKAPKRKKINAKGKIKVVRDFCQSKNPGEFVQTSGIPLHQILRWKEKIRKDLFQDEHADHISKVKEQFQDNFLRKADKMIYKWFVKIRPKITNVAEALKEEASKVAKIDDLKPVVADSWVACFLRMHKIRLKEKEVEVIDCDQDW